MPILIDGHNLIGHLPTLSLDDPYDEEKLLRLLVPYRARVGKAMTVVFDPGEATSLSRHRRLGGIEVLFAPRGVSADALIARRVRRSHNPAEWLVVTSDQKLAESVMRYGARVRSAEAFSKELVAQPEVPLHWRETPPSAEEVDSWLALFRGRG